MAPRCVFESFPPLKQAFGTTGGFCLSPSEPRRRKTLLPLSTPRQEAQCQADQRGAAPLWTSICLCGDIGQQLEWGGWGRHWKQEGGEGWEGGKRKEENICRKEERTYEEEGWVRKRIVVEPSKAHLYPVLLASWDFAGLCRNDPSQSWEDPCG